MTTFRINRVYTRSGDTGETGLVGGDRVSKASFQVQSYGEVDELNSLLGVVRAQLQSQSHMDKFIEVDSVLEYLQQELFDLGSELATNPTNEYPGMWKAQLCHVEVLESCCDRYGESLPELKSFILPGGSHLSASLHLARTVARRAERSLVSYATDLAKNGRTLNPFLIQYLNRLSDFLYVLARYVLSVEGKTTPLWQPERERKLPFR